VTPVRRRSLRGDCTRAEIRQDENGPLSSSGPLIR
jgi:hypothetical protein